MGFWIDIDADDARLLKLLRSNPSEVFGKPYSGYLLFLAGAADEKIVNWISQNLAVLDSLTGEDFAFAIFARKFPITLRAPIWARDQTPRKGSIGDLPLEEARDSYSISKLCKSGRFGSIVNGEVLTAITYAVDDIARGFGVLDDLPCMIVLDGIPNEKFDVVPLDTASTDKLIPLLRKAIGRFRREATFDAYGKSVRKIVGLLDSLSLLNQQRDADVVNLGALKKEMSARVKSEVANVSNARDDLLNGKLKGFRRRLQNSRLLGAGEVGAVIALVNERNTILMQYSRTIAAVRRFIDEVGWPLDAESSKRYESCTEYARLLLGSSASSLSGTTRDQCSQVLSMLEASQQKTINEIMQRIPVQDTLQRRALGERSIKSGALEKQLANYPILIKTRDQELNVAMREHKNLGQSTISKVFAKLAREERVVTIKRAVKDNASVFAGSIFKPEMLLKIWAAIS